MYSFAHHQHRNNYPAYSLQPVIRRSYEPQVCEDRSETTQKNNLTCHDRWTYLQDIFLPKPPACAMLTDSQLYALQIAIENALEGPGFIDRARLPTMENQVAIELVSYSVCSPMFARLDESTRLRSSTTTVWGRKDNGQTRANSSYIMWLSPPRVQGLEEKLSWNATGIRRDGKRTLRTPCACLRPGYKVSRRSSAGIRHMADSSREMPPTIWSRAKLGAPNVAPTPVCRVRSSGS